MNSHFYVLDKLHIKLQAIIEDAVGFGFVRGHLNEWQKTYNNKKFMINVQSFYFEFVFTGHLVLNLPAILLKPCRCIFPHCWALPVIE